jgi:hypothetical protein
MKVFHLEFSYKEELLMLLHDLWKYVKTSNIRIQTHAGLLIEAYDTHKYMNATVEQIHYTTNYILITVA